MFVGLLWESVVHGATYLNPEEQSLGSSFELQHIHPSCSALAHPLELTVIREDDEVLHINTQEMLYSLY